MEKGKEKVRERCVCCDERDARRYEEREKKKDSDETARGRVRRGYSLRRRTEERKKWVTLKVH